MKQTFVCFILVTSSLLRSVKSFGILNKKYDYDVIVLGAGASGMFAAGTAASFGCSTLLVEKCREEEESDDKFHVGGDCTNQACVPSKAIRSVALMAAVQKRMSMNSMSSNGNLPIRAMTHPKVFEETEPDFFSVARQHSVETVEKVRDRESVERLASSPNLELAFTNHVKFVSNHELCLDKATIFNGVEDDDNKSAVKSGQTHITGRKIIIATGADPIVPQQLAEAATKADLPVLTYKTMYRPDGDGKLSDDCLWNIQPSNDKRKHIVIAGGGPVGVETAQNLARLKSKNTIITIVAPSILPSEDVSARLAARDILKNDDVNILIGTRVVDVKRDAHDQEGSARLILSNNSTIPADVLILAIGREPGRNLSEMDLRNAGVEWTHAHGVEVNSMLQSSRRNIYAAGDCASRVQGNNRRATHAGWTGYHAVQSALFPVVLLPSDIVHPFVPSVTFIDPEIASIGMSREECIREYGKDGFMYLKADESGTDRADMDSIARYSNGFVELRVGYPHGRILGATVCSPAAAEIINEIGVALVNKLSCRDIAQSLHAYPSHGYLLHRVALSLALSDVWGLLAACGPAGRLLGRLGRSVSYRLFTRRSSKKLREWQAEGVSQEMLLNQNGHEVFSGRSFLEVLEDSEADIIKEDHLSHDYLQWLKHKPAH